MTTFSAYRIQQEGRGVRAGFEDLTLDDLTPGDVVIRARFSGINYKDALAATGAGRILKRFPLNGGIDVAGVVESSETDAFAPGDEVLVTGCGLGEEVDGGFAQFVRAQADWVVPLPEGMDLWQSMCLGTAGFTAGLAVQRMERNGQSPAMGPIAVTGASGGVGSLVTSMLARSGYEVVGVTGKPGADDFLRRLGASRTLDRRAIDPGKRPLEKALWGGAVDNVGGDLLAWLTRTVDWWGNIASIGLAGGHELNTTVMPFILRGVSLLGINSVKTPRPERLEVWQRLATDLKPDLAAIGTRTEPFAALGDLFQAYVDGQVTGRTVIEMP